jgi:hypothetical protein
MSDEKQVASIILTELQELLSAAAIASLLPHICLSKALVDKGVISRSELDEYYAKSLDSKAFPPAMAALIEPIWKEFLIRTT